MESDQGHSSPLAGKMQLVAGNVATYDGREGKELISLGHRRAEKWAIGPGSICTTRVGDRRGACRQLDRDHGKLRGPRKGTDLAIIADGGIKYSGDISQKRFAAGASCVIDWKPFSRGTEESPGETILYQGAHV